MSGERKSGCLRNLVIGCGAVVVVGIVSIVGMAWVTISPLKKAIADREELEEQLGSEWQPAADGALDVARVEAFLRVRGRVMTLCPDFAEFSEQFRRMDALGDSEPSRKEAFLEAMRTVRAAAGVGRLIGRYIEERNAGLLEEEMVLDEYVWLYLVAYADRFAEEADPSEPFGDEILPIGTRDRMIDQIAEMRRLSLDSQNAADWVVELETELGRLDRDPERVPWEDGLPVRLADQLAPYRGRLDQAYCVMSRAIDLGRSRSDGVSIRIE